MIVNGVLFLPIPTLTNLKVYQMTLVRCLTNHVRSWALALSHLCKLMKLLVRQVGKRRKRVICEGISIITMIKGGKSHAYVLILYNRLVMDDLFGS